MPGTKKLLHSKWSAVDPRNREKHFVVTRVIDPRPELGEGPRVELEAVTSGRRVDVGLEDLDDRSVWTRGWT